MHCQQSNIYTRKLDHSTDCKIAYVYMPSPYIWPAIYYCYYYKYFHYYYITQQKSVCFVDRISLIPNISNIFIFSTYWKMGRSTTHKPILCRRQALLLLILIISTKLFTGLMCISVLLNWDLILFAVMLGRPTKPNISHPKVPLIHFKDKESNCNLALTKIWLFTIID